MIMYNILNGVFYSFYSMERYSYKLLYVLFAPLVKWFGKIVYALNLFDAIDKKNKNFETFMEEKYKNLDVVLNDIDFGASITRSKSSLVLVFVPYEMFFVALLKYKKILQIPNTAFVEVLFLAICVSSFVCYVFSFRGNIYKKYFKSMKKQKNNIKWHALASILLLGALILVFLSIVYWNK